MQNERFFPCWNLWNHLNTVFLVTASLPLPGTNISCIAIAFLQVWNNCMFVHCTNFTILHMDKMYKYVLTQMILTVHLRVLAGGNSINTCVKVSVTCHLPQIFHSYSHLSGVVVSVLATGPKDCGFKPSRGNQFLRMIKFHSTSSFGWK
jgi:hypothetical protein